MIEKISLGLILVFFILAFAVKNISTYRATKKSIRGKSVKLTLSILLSSLIFLLLLLRLAPVETSWIIELDIFATSVFRYIAYGLVVTGFILGLLSLIVMKNSWRVGIKYDQKTELVTTGIFKFSRNPYFLSYDILFLGYVVLFPSVILIILFVTLAIIFHKMILDEEKYLQTVHGDKYQVYKSRVNRYITIK